MAVAGATTARGQDAASAYEDGLRHLSEGRQEPAESAMALAVRLDPSLAAAWLARSVLTRDSARRREWYRRAFLLDPFVDLAVLQARFASAGLEQAWRDLDREVRAEAAPGLRHVPPGTLVMHLLVAARTGRLSDAIADARELLARDGRAGSLERNDVRLMLAVLLERTGEIDQAVRGYQDVITEDLSNFAAHGRLAAIHERRGNLEAAVTERRRAVAANPDDFTLRLALASTLARAGLLREADSELSEVIRMAPWDQRAPSWQRQIRARLPSPSP